MFSNAVMDHFYRPRNIGIADVFTHSYFEQDNPWRIRILFTARVEHGRIEAVRFKTQGCVTAVACCSALTEIVQGLELGRALAVNEHRLSAALGNVPPEKMHCCRLAIAALRRALTSPHQGDPASRSSRGDTP